MPSFKHSATLLAFGLAPVYLFIIEQQPFQSANSEIDSLEYATLQTSPPWTFSLESLLPTCTNGTSAWEMDPFPPSFEPAFYEQNNRAKVDDTVQLDYSHYKSFGRDHGWTATRIQTKRGIIQRQIVPKVPGDILELGPFLNPVVYGPNVKYFDVLDLAGLQERAKAIGYKSVREVPIDFVHPHGNITAVVPPKTFTMVLSSHVIEHQLDLVRHFQAISRILVDGGVYFMFVPDKRFCFDHFVTESTIADILDDYARESQLVASHTLRSVIEHRALTTHNDASAHWADSHGLKEKDLANRVRAAWKEWFDAQSDGRYVDVHNYQFTPHGLSVIVETLQQLGLIDFTIHRIYETIQNKFEFCILLKKCS